MHDNIRRLLTIDVKVSFYRGSGHSGGRYSERKRSKWVKETVAEQLLELQKAKKAAKVRPLVLTHDDIKQAIADGAKVLSSLHKRLLRGKTATGYVITRVSPPEKRKTIQDADGVVFSKDGKTLLACSKPLDYEYVIPKKVRAIADNAFLKNTRKLKTLYLHAKIERIGFVTGCQRLKAIVVDKANPYFCSEDGILYSKDKTCLVKFPPNMDCTEFRVPSFVTEIGSYAFSLCKNLTSIVLHDDIQQIGLCAFINCGVTSIRIPAGMTWIGLAAFGWSNLTSVVIPSNIKDISQGAFMHSRDLTKVEFSEGLERIEEYAFKRCPLTKVKLPHSVKYVSEKAFDKNTEIL